MKYLQNLESEICCFFHKLSGIRILNFSADFADSETWNPRYFNQKKFYFRILVNINNYKNTLAIQKWHATREKIGIRIRNPRRNLKSESTPLRIRRIRNARNLNPPIFFGGLSSLIFSIFHFRRLKIKTSLLLDVIFLVMFRFDKSIYIGTATDPEQQLSILKSQTRKLNLAPGIFNFFSTSDL